jgi:hypothetical protein
MVPDELKQHIGKIDPPHVSESRYGTIIAPPGFFGWSMQSVPSSEGIIGLMTAMINAGYYRILDGGMSYEFFLPVRAGDIVIASPKVKDVTAKEGKSGPMMVCDFETTYLNQNGDLVAKAYQTLIGR